jgi:hypothetical protein
VAAWERDPIKTIATVVAPEWPTAAWHRQYVRRKNPLFTILHRYPEGSHIFRHKHDQRDAPATQYAILVLRLGSTRMH